ncbi:MAG TPA: copper chaperone PCu(A)C [Paucimonas sp.]|nr:copper chaperone PCu(A)C [Paucimonas sp.]
MPANKFFLAAALACAAVSVQAQGVKLGALRIDQPQARATVPGQPSGAAYLTIENGDKSADKLIAASSPVANSVELHTMTMDGDVMRMREVPSIVLPPGAKVAMKPGNGYHIMLMGLKQPLKEGGKFPLTLTFEKAGKAEVEVRVGGQAGAAEHHHH